MIYQQYLKIKKVLHGKMTHRSQNVSKVITHSEKSIPFAHHPMALIQYMEELGVDCESLLQGTDIPEDYEKKAEQYISYRQYAQLISNAKKLSQNPILGLAFGEKLGFSAHGLIGLGMLASTSIYEALKLAVHYKQFVSTVTHVELKNHKRSGETSLTIEPAVDAGELLQFFQETLCSCFYYYAKVLKKADYLPVHFYFSYPQPVDTSEYEKYLNSNLHFNAPCTQMRCESSLLDVSLPFSNAATVDETRQKINQQLSVLHIKIGLLTVIRRYLKAQENSFPSLDTLAQKLNTSTSTLKRKLQQHNTNYQEILDEVRTELACNYLIEENLSIQTISERLNFAEACSFRRAFKKWTGFTPQEYRNQHQR